MACRGVSRSAHFPTHVRTYLDPDREADLDPTRVDEPLVDPDNDGGVGSIGDFKGETTGQTTAFWMALYWASNEQKQRSLAAPVVAPFCTLAGSSSSGVGHYFFGCRGPQCSVYVVQDKGQISHGSPLLCSELASLSESGSQEWKSPVETGQKCCKRLISSVPRLFLVRYGSL